MNMTYNTYIGDIIANIPFGIPFFTGDIINELSNELNLPKNEIKSVVNLNLKRYADENIIERIQKGIYYKPKMTVFGKTKPPLDLAIAEMCTKLEGEVIGYLGGETLLNQLGLSTLLPKEKVIVTNKHRTKVMENTHVILKKPVTEINSTNYRYLQIIDVIAMLEFAFIDVLNPIDIVLDFIEKYDLNKMELLKYAKRHYTNKILLATLNILLEE